VFSDSGQRISAVAGSVRLTTNRLLRGAGDSAGFSMAEVLAVILIVGILVAIALALFSSGAARANDANAKQLARTADTTAQVIANDSGTLTGLSPKELNEKEATVPIAPSSDEPYVSAASGDGSEYEITIKAPSGDEFEIGRNAAGEVSRTCTSAKGRTDCDGAATGSW
jgi:prepilin-type N-terminal cleavage/methylation domain-containing protein